MPAELLPDVVISPEMEEKILHWLHDEIENSKLSRKGIEQKWHDVKEWYDKQELDGKKNYPFEGAAHLMVGIMPTFCETIKAKIANTIWAPSDPFTIKHYDPQLGEFVRPIRRFMTWTVNNEIMLKEIMGPVILEMLKLGTAVTKVRFAKEIETQFEFIPDEEGNDGIWREIPIIVREQPEVLHVQLADLFFQMHARSFEESEWKAHRFRESWNKLKEKESIGEYINVDRIEAWEENQRTDEERESEDPDHDPQPVTMTEYEIYEVWFQHPIKEGGRPVKMQWFIHHEARVALRKRYNWFPLNMDPFDLLIYEEREHKVYGRGVGEISLPYQKEISTMHNQRLDSVTVRNAPLFKKKADSLLPDFIVFRPGGVLNVAEMDEIDVLFTGQQYDSTINDEQHSLAMLRERLGLEDFSQDMNLGQATSVLAVMAERNRRFDHTIQRIRTFLAKIMTKVMLLYQKYYPEGRAIQVQGQDGIYVELLMKFPPLPFSQGMGIDVTATTASTSKELDRQNKLQLFGLITQYYGQITQYALQASNPQFPPPVQLAMLQIVNALSAFVEDLLEDFDLTNATEIANVVQAARQATVAGGGNQGQPQGNVGAAGLGAVPGVAPQASLPTGAGAA